MFFAKEGMAFVECLMRCRILGRHVTVSTGIPRFTGPGYLVSGVKGCAVHVSTDFAPTKDKSMSCLLILKL